MCHEGRKGYLREAEDMREGDRGVQVQREGEKSPKMCHDVTETHYFAFFLTNKRKPRRSWL